MLAKECYEAYVTAAGGKSLVSGTPLPQWEQLPEKIQHAWTCAAAWVAGRVSGRHDWQEPLKDQAIAAKDAEIERLLDKLADGNDLMPPRDFLVQVYPDGSATVSCPAGSVDYRGKSEGYSEFLIAREVREAE